MIYAFFLQQIRETDTQTNTQTDFMTSSQSEKKNRFYNVKSPMGNKNFIIGLKFYQWLYFNIENLIVFERKLNNSVMTFEGILSPSNKYLNHHHPICFIYWYIPNCH